MEFFLYIALVSFSSRVSSRLWTDDSSDDWEDDAIIEEDARLARLARLRNRRDCAARARAEHATLAEIRRARDDRAALDASRDEGTEVLHWWGTGVTPTKEPPSPGAAPRVDTGRGSTRSLGRARSAGEQRRAQPPVAQHALEAQRAHAARRDAEK